MFALLAAKIFSEDSVWIWSMLQFFAIVLSLGFVAWQIYLHRMKNMLDAILSLDLVWKSEKMYKHRSNACKLYPSNPERINLDESAVLGFFEDLGMYLQKKILDPEMIWVKYSYYIERYWDMYKPHIDMFRKEYNDHTWYDKFEYLKGKMDSITDKKGLPRDPKPEADLNKFRGEESRLAPNG